MIIYNKHFSLLKFLFVYFNVDSRLPYDLNDGKKSGKTDKCTHLFSIQIIERDNEKALRIILFYFIIYFGLLK